MTCLPLPTNAASNSHIIRGNVRSPTLRYPHMIFYTNGNMLPFIFYDFLIHFISSTNTCNTKDKANVSVNLWTQDVVWGKLMTWLTSKSPLLVVPWKNMLFLSELAWWDTITFVSSFYLPTLWFLDDHFQKRVEEHVLVLERGTPSNDKRGLYWFVIIQECQYCTYIH